MAAAVVLKDLGLPENPKGNKGESGKELHQSALSFVFPLSSGTGEDAGAMPSHYLLANSFQVLPLKLVEKV